MPNNYVLLERIELNASATSVTFANIPQTGYTDLKVVASYRGSGANVYEISYLRFNGLNANLSSRSIEGNGSAASSITNTQIYFGAGNGATSTANTFSNIEAYIPNYRSSNQKSVSIDAVGETNGTTIYMQLTAGLWANTAAITSIEIVPANSFLANSTFSLYGLAALGTTPTIAPKASGGNIIATDGTYWYHAFTSSGTFTPAVGLTCDVLVVAGGGGGGFDAAGGGGAGGVIYKTSASATTAAETITVGAGGTGATSSSSTAGGSNSTAFTMTAFGGGIGGPGGTSSSRTGGSGGGGGWGQPGAAATQTSNGGGTGYGNAGGNGGTNNYPGGGGGGAGAAAANCTTNAATAGGIGLNTWSSWASATNTGDSGYFAGGGGGGAVDASRAAGGLGGGGTGTQGGSSVAEIAGTNAIANTGGGGGGGGSNISPSQSAGYNGGSGIIIVRYPI